jgi:DUF4097 and DUF4098 domain-containing protein YvlB
MAALGPVARGAALALALGAQAAGPALADSQYAFARQTALPGGSTVVVRNVNGSVTVSQSRDRQAHVDAVITSRRGNARDVKIQVSLGDYTLYVCPVYPGQTVSSDCTSRGSTFNNNDARVDFTIRIPKGSPLRVSSVNGRVEARGLDAKVEAKSVNGAIAIDTSATASAEATNGRIDATLGARRWNGALDFKSVGGSIGVRLPRDAAFTLNANTLNGNIVIRGFPLGVNKGGFVGRSANGAVGKNGGALNLKTVNGTLTLDAR